MSLQAVLDSSELPIVDVSGYLAGDAKEARKAADQLSSSLEEIGFFLLVGSGVDESLVRGAYAQAKRFFDQPMEKKMAVALGGGRSEDTMNIMTKKGYVSFEGKSEYDKSGDSRDRNAVESIWFNYQHLGQNQWPNLPGFRETIYGYYERMDKLFFDLLPLFSLSLGVPDNFFYPMFESSLNILRLSHNFPSEPGEDTTDRWGFLAHTDQNFITLLPANEVSGLEIRRKGGGWTAAPYIPGSFVVNSGDILRYWSNGRFLSTPHRVLKPTQHRYAMPFFCTPNADTMIDPIVSARDVQKLPSLGVMDHLRQSYLKRDLKFLKELEEAGE